MRPIKEQQQAHARNLYFQSDLTRAQLAQQVGVSEKTIYLWAKQGDWQRLRSGSRLMPSMLVEHFCAQVQELNEAIQSRPPGQRYPTPQEAETQRKLVVTAERIKKKGTQGEYMELMQKFMTWLMPKGNGFAQVFTDLADEFLKENAVAGFRPYDIEYEEPGLLSSALPKGAKAKDPAEDPGQPFTDPNQLSLFPENAIPPLKGNSPGSPTSIPPAFPPWAGREASIASVPGAKKQSQDNTDLQPNQSNETNNTSCCAPVPHPCGREGQGEVEQVTTGNNSNPPYDAPTATSSENTEPQEEITQPGNNPELPPLASLPGTEQAQDNTGHPKPRKEKKPAEGVAIGYLGTKDTVTPKGTTIIDIKREEPNIQKFSIGGAIYYIKKKE